METTDVIKLYDFYDNEVLVRLDCIEAVKPYKTFNRLYRWVDHKFLFFKWRSWEGYWSEEMSAFTVRLKSGHFYNVKHNERLATIFGATQA